MKFLEPTVEETEYSKKWLTSGTMRELSLSIDKIEGPAYPLAPASRIFIITESAPNSIYPRGWTKVVMHTFRDWQPWHRKKGFVRARFTQKTLYLVEGIHTEEIIERLIAGEYSECGLTPHPADAKIARR